VLAARRKILILKNLKIRFLFLVSIEPAAEPIQHQFGSSVRLDSGEIIFSLDASLEVDRL
jgi:hypothetical protein